VHAYLVVCMVTNSWAVTAVRPIFDCLEEALTSHAELIWLICSKVFLIDWVEMGRN